MGSTTTSLGSHIRDGYQSPAAAVAASLHDGKKHLLVAASGSVATIKLPLIVSSLEHLPDVSIRIILTKSATHFLAGQSEEQPTIESLNHLRNVDSVHTDEDEWAEPWTRGAEILHITLRRWAHLLVIAPMSANLLAKVTGGLCDDLLTSVVRAWDTRKGKLSGPTIIAAPSMNEMMWSHPLTARQVAILDKEWDWFEVLPPQVKALACGDVGQGGMCDWQEISKHIRERLALVSVEEVF